MTLTNARVNCLVIDDLLNPESPPSGLSSFTDMAACFHLFRWRGESDLHEALQAAHYAIRNDGVPTAILARRSGCDAALALAEQLPVDRLVLIEPEGRRSAGLYGKRERQATRLRAFARRNLSLCVADTLIVEAGNSRMGRVLWNGGFHPHSRVERLVLLDKIDNYLYTNREFSLKSALAHFLQSGELPKSLAENPEMCIIYE